MGRTRLVGLALTVAMVVAGAGASACGGGDDDANGGAAGGAVRTTTTTHKATTTSESPTTTGGTGDPADLADGPDFSDTEASGAGCAPGNVTALPAGWWAGTITAVHGDSIDFDLLCFYTGAPAEAAAKEDGTEVDNDYYTRDNNHRTFTETFAPDAYATCVDDSVATFACTVGQLLPLYPADGAGDQAAIGGHTAVAYPLVWVHVTGTTADSLWVMFTP